MLCAMHTAKKHSFKDWVQTSFGRLCLVGAVIVLAVVAYGLCNVIQGLSNRNPVATYRKADVSFRFGYPADFTDSTKPGVFGPNPSELPILQQSLKSADGAVSGYIRGTYHKIGSGDSRLRLISNSLTGGDSAVASLSNDFSFKNQLDCNIHQLMTTQSGHKILKCNLSRDYLQLFAGKFSGAVLIATDKQGYYQFDYLVSTQYLSSHLEMWSRLYSTADYNF